MMLVTTGSLWKHNQLPKSRSETHVSSSSYSYHDAVQRDANSSHLSSPHSCVVVSVNVGIVLRHPRLGVENLNNCWRLLILIFVFAVYKRTLFYFVNFYILCIYLGFICYNREVFLELESTFQIKEFAQSNVYAIV